MVKEVQDFSFTMDVNGKHKLPKHALYMEQAARDNMPMRWVYVLDMRECLHESFRVYVYVPQVGRVTYYRGNPGCDSISRLFMQYVLKKYGDMPYSSIPGPIWPICHKDNIGQPHNRKPQQFDTKNGYIRGQYRVESKSVIDGCRIGNFKHNEESYHHIVLGMQSQEYDKPIIDKPIINMRVLKTIDSIDELLQL